MAGMNAVAVGLVLCLLVGVGHGFEVEQPEGSDSDWQFSVDGNSADEPVLANEHEGRLVGTFNVKGFEAYDAGVAGFNGDANVDQVSEYTFADLPEQFSSSRFGDSYQVQENTFSDEQESQFDTQGSSSGDDGYVYNARLQSSSDTPDSGVNGEPDNAASYDYNRGSSLPEGFSAPASEFYHEPSSSAYVLGVPEEREESSSSSYVLGVPEEREQEALPEYVYDAREESGANGASFSSLNVQGDSDDHAVAAEDVSKTSEVEDSLPAYVYDARAASPEGSADSASFTTTDVQESSEDGPAPANGHEGPVSYYTPASDPDGAFEFYDARSDEEKKLDTKVDDDSAGAASFAQNDLGSSDTTTSASTSPVLATAKAAEGTHGCPNSYWAEHVEQWPPQFQITTLVSQAFGGSTLKTNLEIIYGTTTLFQALLDTRDGPYSKLLRHAVAALLNAHAKSAYTHTPEEVAQLFNAALASKAAAAAQAQKFENENHAFGENECK